MTRPPIRRLAVAAALVAAVTALSLPAAASTRSVAPTPAAALTTPVRGQDISWPECPKGMGNPARPSPGKPMPGSAAKFVIVGITTGPAFKPNPCLASQAAWVKAHHVYAAPYAVVAYPTAAQLSKFGTKGPYTGTSLTARLRNVGWNEAQFNMASARKVGLSAPFIWADVEVTRTTPWSSHTTRNTAVMDGLVAGYRAAGVKAGIYSTRAQWGQIMGSARYGLLEWHTAGASSLTAARRACTATSFNGGRAVLAQWWTALNDYDVMCRGYDTTAAMAKYFHKF